MHLWRTTSPFESTTPRISTRVHLRSSSCSGNVLKRSYQHYTCGLLLPVLVRRPIPQYELCLEPNARSGLHLPDHSRYPCGGISQSGLHFCDIWCRQRLYLLHFSKARPTNNKLRSSTNFVHFCTGIATYEPIRSAIRDLDTLVEPLHRD